MGQVGQRKAGTGWDFVAQVEGLRGGFWGLAWVVLGIGCHSSWVAESREIEDGKGTWY